MATDGYPEEHRRTFNHTPGDVDHDEGGARLMSEIAVPPYGAPELLAPSPFPRLESPKREQDYLAQVHHDDDENPYVGRAETTEGDLSMPVEHVRHLLDLDSSFRSPGKSVPGESSLNKASPIVRKADSSIQDEDVEDFDDFSMIHPEQTPSLKERKNLIRNSITSVTSPSIITSNSAKLKQIPDLPTSTLPPLNKVHSRSTQRRLERSYSNMPSTGSRPGTRILQESTPILPSSDDFDSPLPQHSSDTEFTPSSPIVSAQARRKLQQSYNAGKAEPSQRPERLHRSDSTTSTKSAHRRPKFLRSRQGSTRSSISSVNSDAYKGDEDEEREDGGSTILGVKPHRGEARGTSPAKRGRSFVSNRGNSPERDLSEDRDGSRDYYDSKGDTDTFGGPLSRTTSLGSIASGATGLGMSMVAEATGGPVKRNHLDPVKEVKSGIGSDDGHYEPPRAVLDDTDSDHNSVAQPEKVPLSPASPDEQPRTPTNAQPRMPNPTMTAINNRVSEIQIPATVAREFYASQKLPCPPSAVKLQLGEYGKPEVGKKDMTLKEQNAVIDKLHKQAFDLKLRCFFLDQKVQSMSEEGMNNLHNENVDLKVQIWGLKKEIKLLKREIKESKSGGKKAENTEGDSADDGAGSAREVEITELRERVERYEIEIERLKRKIAGDAGVGVDEVEILKDLLENESLRREQAELDNQRLREEISQLRQQLGAQNGSASLQPPLMMRRPSATSYSDSHSNAGGSTTAGNPRVGDNHNIDTSRLMERLRDENEELRREVGAQTSMLTSRNKERDGLYQQIEEMKLHMRSHGSLRPAGSSASMAGGSDQLPRFQHLHHGTERSVSRNSFAGSTAILTDAEREDMENMNGILRDRICELKLQKQELELQLQSAIRELQEYDKHKLDMEQTQMDQSEEISYLTNELRELTLERDIAIRDREATAIDFEDLKAEAEEELEKLEIENLHYQEELNHLEQLVAQKEEEVAQKEEDFEALQLEMRGVSEHVIALEDSQVRRQEFIEEQQAEIHALKQQSEVLEKKFHEEEQNSQRLNVQLESTQEQITFLKEEQDGDKIKIGLLENEVKKIEEQVREEREKAKDWERTCNEERKKLEKEREKGREGEGLERKLLEREKELRQKDEELRRLHKAIAKRENEAKQRRDRLEEVEGDLRAALGGLTGTKENLLESITRLQAQLDAALEELGVAKRQLGERERTLRDRENLLESMALETKKLSETLEKERQARQHEKNQVDNLESKNQQHRRQLSQREIQLNELEKTRNRETRANQSTENQLRQQVTERNALLTTLWSRFSAICGPKWAHRNSHVTTVTAAAGGQQGRLSMEAAVTQAFVGFSKNLINAVKAVENVVGEFEIKCKGIERDLWKEYQVVESALESKTKRLERLETLVRGGLGESSGLRAEVAKLRADNRLLRAEVAKLGGGVSRGGVAGSSSPPTKERRKSTVAERLSHVFEGSNSGNGASNSAGSSNSNNNVRETTTSSNTTEKITTKSSTSRARELFNSLTRSSKPQVPPSPPPNQTQNKTPASPATAQPTAATVATKTSLVITEPTDSGEAQAENGEHTDPVTEKRWIMRLRELEKRLKSEREARIIDRSGAKKRLEEEREEIEVLRRELEREREKWLSVEVPGVEGPKERLSIEDVKKDDSAQQTQQEQQQQQQQQQSTGASSLRDSRERRDPTVGERRPRRSSRAPLPNFTDPPPDQQSNSRVDYKDRGYRESASEDPPQLQVSPSQLQPSSQRERGSSSRRPTDDETRRERGVSRQRGAVTEETREERRERKEREREERRVRKEREGGSWRGASVVSPVNSGVSTGDR